MMEDLSTVTTVPIEVTFDTSGSFGCGAFTIPHGWFRLQRPSKWQAVHITAKELVPVVISAAVCVCVCGGGGGGGGNLNKAIHLFQIRWPWFISSRLHPTRQTEAHKPGLNNFSPS